MPPYPRSIRPELPPPAEAAIIKALAKNPPDRFQTASDFAAAFTEGLQNRYTASNPVPAMNPTPVQTMMAANTSGQYIPQTTATPTPFPAPAPTYPPTGMPLQQPTTLPPAYQPQPPRPQRSMNPILIGVIGVLILALVAVLGFGKLSSGNGPTGNTNPTATTSGATGANPTATTASTNPTATTAGTNPTTTATVSLPSTTDYAAAQPGPGCDTSGGTWTPKGIDKITCGTQLYIYQTQVYGYLSLQLPGGKAFAPNNVINVTGNPQAGNSPAMCVGLAETDANTGYMADYCGDGTWNIYEISSAGSIIHTYQKGVTSTRDSTNISLTLKGSSLTFVIDTETHTVNNLQPIQPASVAIVYYNGNHSGSCCFNYNMTVNNFGYTILTS